MNISGEPWTLYIHNQKVTKNIREELANHCSGGPLLEYWTRKRFRTDPLQLDWDATHRALKAVSVSRRHWVIKHSSGFCGVNKWMHRWRKRASAACPRCNDPNETAAHVWTCRTTETDKMWKRRMENLYIWLNNQNTLPDLTTTIIEALNHWRTGEPINPPTSTYPNLGATAAAQTQAGWRHFFEGTPVIGWAEIQQQHLEWLGRRQTGKRWLIALIQKMWDIAWDLWEQRNKILHNVDEGIEIAAMNEEIRELFLVGSRCVPPYARPLFSTGVNHILNTPPDHRRAWLQRVRSAKERYERLQEEADNSNRASRAFMRDWLSGIPTNTRT